MKRARVLGPLLWLAFALAAGPLAVVVHDLGHLADRVAQEQDSHPGPATCDAHFACSQLASAMGAWLPAAPIVVRAPPRGAFGREILAPAATRLAFFSRAPPAGRG